jgi:multidrug efflux pump subunit AcrB
MRRPLLIFGAAFFLCIAGLLFLINRPAGFVSAEDAAEAELLLTFPPGTSLESMGAETEELAGRLAALPHIQRVFGRAGAEAEDLGKRSDPDYRKEVFRFRCLFDLKSDPREALAEIQELMEGTGASPGVYSAGSGFTWRAAFPQDKTEKLLGLSSSLSLVVKAKDGEELEERRLEAEKSLAASEYSSGLNMRPWGTRPELRIIPDREASAFLGITMMDTARALYAATEGYVPGELEIEGRPLAIRVSADLKGNLLTMPIAQTERGPVFLGSLAGIERRESEAVLARLDRNDVLYFDLSPKPGKQAELVRYIRDLCRSLPGLSRADESAFSQYRLSLTITALLVLFLLYLTMGAEFESFTLPLILMLTIPFSLAGSGPSLFLCGAGLDSSSVLGLLVLFGLAVNHGMVLYERGVEKMNQGIPPAPAVYGAARERLRPVLTTTLTTVFALFPLVVSLSGTGQRSMAAAMLGGISASVLLSLFALPPVFMHFSAGKGVHSE